MELPTTIVGCHELILKQATLITKLLGRVEKLEGQIQKNNKPPSSDGLHKRPAFPRGKGKKWGGQVGHKGRKLDLSVTIDRTELLYPTNCKCWIALNPKEGSIREVRQEFDLPSPKHITSSTQYGSGVKSLTVLLNSGYALPVKKVQSLFIDLFGYSINESTIINNTNRCNEALVPIETEIKAKLLNSPVGHSDETGVRVV